MAKVPRIDQPTKGECPMSDLFGNFLRPKTTVLQPDGPDGPATMPIADRRIIGGQASDDDVDLLGRLIYSEADNDLKAMQGVGSVVKNRMKAGSKSLNEVIYKTYMLGNKKMNEFNAVDSSRWMQWDIPELPDDEAKMRDQARNIARELLEDRIEDPTDGAIYFHNGVLPSGFMKKGVKSGRLMPTTKLGKMSFLKEVQRQRR
jgi:spore germination cell wall hydrolase CwlJ-like protein